MNIVEYENNDCTGDIRLQYDYSCHPDYCTCGYDECDMDQVMLVEMAEYIADNDSCVDYGSVYLLKDVCIAAGWYEYLIPDWNSTQTPYIKLYCDQEEQEIGFYTWSDENCQGSPSFDEPQILVNEAFFQDPCYHLSCDADDILPWITSTTLEPNTI